MIFNLTINLEEMKELIKTNISLPKEKRVTQCFLGPVGCGKSYTVLQTCKELNKRVSIINLSNTTRENITGIPAVNFKELFANLLNKANKKEAIESIIYTKPYFIDSDVIFIDEITNASEDEISIVMQMITERIAGTHKLKDDTVIILAGNNTDDSDLASELPSPILTRCSVFKVKSNIEETLKYAKENNYHKKVISFLENMIKENKTLSYKKQENNMPFATNRTIKFLSNLMYVTEKLNLEEKDFEDMVRGVIGKEYSEMFVKS